MQYVTRHAVPGIQDIFGKSGSEEQMKWLAMGLAGLFLASIAQAQTGGQPLNDSALKDSVQLLPDRFMSVTAENGQEWLEQCEWPAQKSDSMARIAACLSFLQGARAVATRRPGNGNCPVDFSGQSRGALLTTTYQIARRYPRMPINKIFRLAFDSVESGSC